MRENGFPDASNYAILETYHTLCKQEMKVRNEEKSL